MVGLQTIDIKWYPVDFCILHMALSGFHQSSVLFIWKCAIGSLYLWPKNVVSPSSLAQWLTMTKKQNQKCHLYSKTPDLEAVRINRMDWLRNTEETNLADLVIIQLWI